MNFLIINGTQYQDAGTFVPIEATTLQDAKVQLKTVLASQCAVYALHGGVTSVSVYGSLHYNGVIFCLGLTAAITSGQEYNLQSYVFTESWSTAYANT